MISKILNRSPYLSVTTLLFTIIFGVLIGPSPLFSQTLPNPEQPIKNEFVRGRIIDIISDTQREEYGTTYRSQLFSVQLYNNEIIEVPYETDLGGSPIIFVPNNQIILTKVTSIDGSIQYYISDHYRIPGLILLALLFCFLVAVIGKTQGIRSLLGLLLSFIIIFGFIIPRIAQGANPIWTSFFGATGISIVSMFISHGFKRHTRIAIFSMIITLCLAFASAGLIIHSIHLFGLGTEEAFYLQFAGTTAIDLRGLLLAGIVLGVLGVLDDITIAQSSAVQELSRANPNLSWRQLYHHAMTIGREHIAALINTLALAYVGAAFPVLLLIRIYETPTWVTINSELVAEEVIRIIIGSSALMLAVPLATILAAKAFEKK